jgi:hypothetical protein
VEQIPTEKQNNETNANMMEAVVKEFSTSKWKPVEKTSSTDSATAEPSDIIEPVSQEIDMDMDDLKADELEIEINDSNPLPDLRTVISRPSSISDIESDDYQIKPRHKKSKDNKKKKRKESITDKHSRTVSYEKSHRTRDDSSSPERRKSRKEKREKKSKKKKSRRNSESSPSPERRKPKVFV